MPFGCNDRTVSPLTSARSPINEAGANGYFLFPAPRVCQTSGFLDQCPDAVSDPRNV